jgi:RNA polymerase sigma-70 factor (ECF subfamily)
LLVLRAQSGDREAIDRVLAEHQSDLFGYLLKMLRDHSDAEDALQTTLLQTVRKLRWLQNPVVFRAWMFRIASRVAFRTMKARRRNLELSNVVATEEIPDHEIDDSDKDELVEQIPVWLDRLSPKGHETVILHYLKGFTTEQVAEILDIPLGTAKSRISYALVCIRKWIEPQKEES